jgi:hypothetical protein
VRQATTDDVNQIAGMFMQSFIEKHRLLPVGIDLDVHKVMDELNKMLCKEEVICFIDEHGIILGYVGSLWYSQTPAANTLFWYVEPGHRNGKLAAELLKCFEIEAKSKHARGVVLNPVTLDSDRLMGRYLKPLGYWKLGGTYVKPFNN